MKMAAFAPSLPNRLQDVTGALKERLIPQLGKGIYFIKEMKIACSLVYGNVTLQDLKVLLIDARRVDLLEIVNQFQHERLQGTSTRQPTGYCASCLSSTEDIGGIDPGFLARHTTDNSLRGHVSSVDNLQADPALLVGNGSPVTCMPWNLPHPPDPIRVQSAEDYNQLRSISTQTEWALESPADGMPSPASTAPLVTVLGSVTAPGQENPTVAELNRRLQAMEQSALEKETREREERQERERREREWIEVLDNLRKENELLKQQQVVGGNPTKKKGIQSSSNNISDDEKYMRARGKSARCRDTSSSTNSSDDEKMLKKFPVDTISSESSSGKDGGESSSDSSLSM